MITSDAGNLYTLVVATKIQVKVGAHAGDADILCRSANFPATQQERQEMTFTILKKNYNQMNNDKLHSLTDSQVSRCLPPRSTQFVYIRLKEKGILVVHGGTPETAMLQVITSAN